MRARVLIPAGLLCLTLACARGREDAPPPPLPDCPQVYVAAPGNYIVDIASGAEVVLDPAAEDFDLFCKPEEARAAVEEGMRSGALPEGDWRIYRLDGTLEDLAQWQGDRYTLGRMAQVVDWVTE